MNVENLLLQQVEQHPQHGPMPPCTPIGFTKTFNDSNKQMQTQGSTFDKY